MTKLAEIPGLRARFEESKQIGLLEAPLVTRGTLWFAPPDRLLRTVDAPHEGRVLLVGDELWVSDGQRTERIELGDDPTVRSFVGSFRALLGGDAQALSEHFTLSLRPGHDDAWTLALTPKTDKMRRIVRRMQAAGRGAALERLVVVEPNGDTSTTRFSDVDTARVFSRKELARLFEPPVSA